MFLSIKQKIVFALYLFLCSNLFAQINDETSDSNNETTILQEITVKSSKDITEGEISLLDNKKVVLAPTPTNSITDALRTSSNIQFSQDSRSSATGGEIAPPRVSIRGSQHYENNFMINGISNNNNLNPSGFRAPGGNTVQAPSGEAQSIFLDTSLVESITTHTEAVSAEYGSFTGGVVDAKLKDAHTDKWHVIAKYRYSTDDWAKYHLTDAQKNITYSTTESYQPEFTKYEYTIALDGPINDYLGLMVSYANQHSKIPLWSAYDINSSATATYKERRIQYRNNDNYLIKLNTNNIDDFEASLTAIYAPYTYSTFMNTIRYSDVDMMGGGINIAYDMKNALKFGTFKNTLAFKRDETSTKSDRNYLYNWIPDLNYANWSYSNNAAEGYFGGKKFTKESLIYKSILDFDEIEIGSLEHSIKTGLEVELGKARYQQGNGYMFKGPQADANATGEKENAIIDGQWIINKFIYEAADNKKSYTTTALFLEDSIKVNRYTIRPGVRISIDTVTDNTDIAPRLFANADIFDDETLNIYGGYNRYYGGLILYNAIYDFNYKRYTRTGYNIPWVYDNSTVKYNYSLDGLKTPYSDEFSIGSSLNYEDTLFKLDFVKREYKDQIKQRTKTIDNKSVYVNTNDGKSDYWGVTLTAFKEYKLGNTKHFSGLSVTNSKTSTNSFNRVNDFESTDAYSLTHVTYNGELAKYEDISMPNYNSPWVITYTHITELSDFLRLRLDARYEKGVDGLRYITSSGGKLDPDGLKTRVYETKHYNDTFTIDLSVDYDLKFKGNKLTFGLEVLNLLNRKNDASYVASSSNIDGYAMGRQFYANVKYEY
ncbi:MAG: TonB-dependent receptor plug domain-containing protein [Campylobacteraceae bacterium]|jgi:hypothetical protein|nr:TonB-dependent receptor plug domain-containing protein [Campylobacteraceae bacterium]